MNKVLSSLIATAGLISSSALLADARVSVAHFAPFAEDIDATSVSVALNGTVVLENVKFKDFTPYLELTEGVYVVDIIPTGTTTPAITKNFNLVDGQDYTVYATGNGSLQPLDLVALADDNSAPAAGNLKIRVVHAAPFAADLAATEVSIRTAGGDLVGGLQGVPFGGASGYLEVPAGTYDLKVASNDGSVNYIDPVPAALPAGAIVTIFAVGDGVNQPLGIIAVPVGELPVRANTTNASFGTFQLYDGDGNMLDGQGFSLIPIPSQNRLVGQWYTYAGDENGTPIWLSFDSTTGGFADNYTEAVLYTSTGMTANADQATVEAGTIEFDTSDCNMIEVTVNVDGQLPAHFMGERLTPSSECN